MADDEAPGPSGRANGPEVPGAAATIIDLRERGGHIALARQFAPDSPSFLSICTQMYRRNAQMAAIEWDYRDADYRSEFGRYYAGHFRAHSALAARVHFFADAPPEELASPDKPMRFHGLAHLGYCVLRPLTSVSVGRSLVLPPRNLGRWVTCRATDEVHVFGANYVVEGSPFISQDREMGRCAHAVIWMAAYIYWQAREIKRVLPVDVVDAVPVELGEGRPLPSPGLNARQVAETYRRIGLPAVTYSTRAGLTSDQLGALVRPYLDSGLPAVMGGNGHTVLLVGYQRRSRRFKRGVEIEYIYNDDLAGPYQTTVGEQSYWEQVVVPLPPKLYLRAEDALDFGRAHLEQLLEESSDAADTALLDELHEGTATYQAIAIRSNDFKGRLEDRLVPGHLAAEYERIPMPRWIWVIEIVHTRARDRGEPCVAADIVLDTTSSSASNRLAWRIPSHLGRLLEQDLDDLRRRTSIFAQREGDTQSAFRCDSHGTSPLISCAAWALV